MSPRVVDIGKQEVPKLQDEAYFFSSVMEKHLAERATSLTRVTLGNMSKQSSSLLSKAGSERKGGKIRRVD